MSPARDAPDFTPLAFAQRFTGRLADGGTTIDGTWETADDGVHWEHDFILTYTRLSDSAAGPGAMGGVSAQA